jgi:glutathione S-transferase
MTEQVTIWGIPGSPYLRATLLGLEEKGVAYTLAPLAPPETKQPAHLARHPFGRIPAFQHGDFALYETQAILRYVNDVFPGQALEPTDPRAKARMNQIVGIVDWYFFRDISATISFNRVVAPMFGIPTDEAAIANAMPKAKICLAEVDNLIGDGPYAAGEMLTIADLMLSPHLDFLAMTPESRDLLGPYPRLTAYIERMRARASMQKTSMEALRKAA